jgi:hypothetical protein
MTMAARQPVPQNTRQNASTLMFRTLRSAMAGSLLIYCLTAFAQDKGNWRATSTTARSITGDIALSDEKLSINFSAFTVARIRTLDKPEISAVFDADSNAVGTGSLYRLNIPAARKFLHKNSLCGDEDTKWMVTYVSDHSLQLALFSGDTVPTFTFDAIRNSTALCGTFTYGK